MWGIVVALLSGALMSLQGIFNTEVTKQSSIWAAAGWVQMTALVTCVVLYFVTGRGEIWGMFSIDRKYMLLGGVMGAFITWTVIKSMDGLGPAKATLLIVVTQILVSYVAEVYTPTHTVFEITDACKTVLLRCIIWNNFILHIT